VIDTGNMSMRTMLIKRFAGRGVKPADITDLLLTHSHHDHSTMFPKARIVIGADELAWSLTVPWGETPVPELYMRELNIWPTLHRAADGEEVFPGITAHLATRWRRRENAAPRPGHERNLLSPQSGDLPVGRFVERGVQPPLKKYFGFRPPQITSRTLAIPSHTEGRIAIVTNAGWDAVDAAASCGRWDRRAGSLNP
jgi:glyoxylase-like metal-dependent hydrolase (beta-lactamase superfamily II)